jgi:hypothetical protein
MADETKAPAKAGESVPRYNMVGLTRCGEAWQELQRDPDGDWVPYDDHRAALARAEAENARAAEEGFKIAARLTARVEEADARAARAEAEREEARAKLDNVQQVCSAAMADAQVSRARADAAPRGKEGA